MYIYIYIYMCMYIYIYKYIILSILFKKHINIQYQDSYVKICT